MDKLDDYLEKELKKFYIYPDKELGLNEYDYLDKDGHFLDFQGNKYRNDKSYLTFKKFYEKMKPTKDDFNFLKLHFRGDNDYSFVKSPSIRHLLFNDIKLEDIDKNDPYYSILDYDKRKIMYELIELLELKTIDDDDYNIITENILQIIKDDNYIYTDYEKDKTFSHETILDYFVSP